MEEKSTVAVIVPAYNCQDTIKFCVEAILNSACSPTEIIVIDDCSTDATPQILESLRAAHPHLINVVKAKKNEGPARARNLGASISNSKYYLFLDADTKILPNALGFFVQRIQEYDAVVGMYDFEPINQSPSPWYKSLLYAYLHDQGGVQPYDQFSAGIAGIKSSVYKALGGFDEWFVAGVDFENEEFGHRISSRYHMVLDPDIRAAHVFPTFKKMTKTFCFRTACWVELFSLRKKFNKKANSPSIAISSMAMLFTVISLFLSYFFSYFWISAIIFYIIHLSGFVGFFVFVWKKYPRLIVPIFLLNTYYTLVIALGACLGAFRIITNRAFIKKYFVLKEKMHPLYPQTGTSVAKERNSLTDRL